MPRLPSRRHLVPAFAAIAALAAFAHVFGASNAAAAEPDLSPFARKTAPSLSPFGPARRLAQGGAQKPTGPTAATGAAAATGTAADSGATSATAEPAAAARAGEPVRPPASSAGQPLKAGDACTSDEQCPGGTICEANVCTAFERPIHALLFRKEAGSTAFIPFYFGRRGNPGHRVIAPFYWHFWSPTEKTRIVAPFFWRFEDYVNQRVVTVVPPFSHTKEPGAESWAVWPLFYRSTKFGWAAPLLFSFQLNRPAEGRSLGLYGLLYFWTRNPRSSFDLFFPFMVSTRSPGSSFTFALPLNFHWRSGATSNTLAIPFVYRQSTPTSGLTITPLGYVSSERTSTKGAAAWVYWFGRSKEAAHDVVFPLLWSFRSPGSSTTLALPLFVHVRRGPWSLTSVFPLYWAASDTKDGSAWTLLAPFFFSRRSPGDRSFTWVSPLGGYRRDSDTQTRTFAWLFPPILHRRDPRTELDMVALLFWRHHDIPGNATTHLVGNYYRRRDPGGDSDVFFPFYWRFRDAASNATAHALLPFFFRRSSPEDTTTAAGALPLAFAYHRRFPDGWSAGLFPVAFFGSRVDRGHAVVFPLFWHLRDRRGTATLLFPLFWRHSDEKHAFAIVPPLLYFQVREHADRAYVQFPFFWHFVDGVRGVATTVVPPFYLQTRKDGWSAGLFPLLFASTSKTRSHFVLFPLFWRFTDQEADRHTTVVANYLHRRHGGETTDAFFPLFWYRRGARPGGQDETSLTLFPLVHYRRDATSTRFVSPVAAWMRSPERKAGLIPPYFWYESRSVSASGILPVYFDVSNKVTGERTRLFGPWFHLDSPKGHARILFPLFGRYWDDREQGTWAFPTYFRRRTNDGYALDTLVPLFWRSTSPQHSTWVVGPFYNRTTTASAPGGESRVAGLAPLLFYARNSQRSFLLGLPLFYRQADYKAGTSYLTVLGLFHHTTRPEGQRTVVFPLWWSGRNQGRVDGMSQDRTYKVLFPLFWRFTDARQDSEQTLAGPFYWSRFGKYRLRGIMPVAWYSRDDENQLASHAVLPFFYEKHGPAQQTVLTLLFGWKTAPDRTWWYAGPIFRRDSMESTFTMVFPLWFSHFNKNTETRTRLVPPLLHFSREQPDRSLSAWALLFWRGRSISGTTTLLLPLFYDVHRFHQSRLTLGLPLFLRYANLAEKSAYTFAPLFYRRSSPDSSTTVAFPLYWDFSSVEKRTTLALPFYVRARRPTYTAHFVFPNVYYRSGQGTDAGTSRLFVFPLWESAVKRPGDYMWEALLGLFGWERIGRNRYLKLFFIPFELEPAPAAQTAFHGKVLAPSRRARATGLNTRVW